MKWKNLIRNIPDWPKPGILFRDITPLLQNGEAFSEAIDELAQKITPLAPESIFAAEARGFIFGAALSLKLKIGFVPIRKKGKLPAETISEEYNLEYGTDILEIHKDALKKGEKTLFLDDLLATGGTTAACIRLARKLGAEVVGNAFIIELEELKGREKLPSDIPIISLLKL